MTTRPGEDLFDTFPNSYGSLGYATRLRIELEQVPGQVGLRHVRFSDFGLLAKAIAEIVETGEWHGEQVDGLDGVAFEPGEGYLTLARWLDEGVTRRKTANQRLHRPGDLLPLAPAARGRPAQHLRLPLALGHRLVLVLAGVRCPEPADPPALAPPVAALGRLPQAGPPRPQVRDRQATGQAGRPARGGARGAGRRDPRRTARGVPRVVRRGGRDAAGLAVPPPPAGRTHLALVPSRRGRHLRQRRILGRRQRRTRTRPRRRATGPSRRRCTSSAATSRSTPRPFTTPKPSIELYDGANLAAVKQRHDPDNRFTSLYDKAVKRR